MRGGPTLNAARRDGVRGALLAVVLGFTAPAAAQPFDRAAWVADFNQLKDAVTRRSPNLEWAAERGMDLPATERRARERLAAATDDAGARVALDRFVRSFADGHMELSWPAPPRASAAPALRSTCAALGYRSDPDSDAAATRLAGYAPVGPQDGPVRAGLVRQAGRTLGVLRIPIFAPSESMCAAVLAERGMPADAPCDAKCADGLSRRADALFLSAIADRIRLLAAAPADLLLLDVAGNGGGDDSSIATARMIGGPDVPTPRLAFLRSAARLEDLAEDEAELWAGLAEADPADRALVRRLLPTYAKARAQAARPCDLSPLWRGERADCTNLVNGPFHAGGLTPTDPFGGPRTGVWAAQISATARFAFTPARWTGPVLVLVDGNSASSTELLAAMLQDARRAVIIGSPTFGAGCGWTLPREDVVLRHSGGRLALPDCARRRRDGSNELDGIEPDILVGFRQFDTPEQRVRRLLSRLPVAIDATMRMPR